MDAETLRQVLKNASPETMRQAQENARQIVSAAQKDTEMEIEYRRIRAQAEQDLKDLNAGREKPPLNIGRDLLKLVALLALTFFIMWLLSGCLTIKTRNAEVVAVGSVERAHVSPAGEVTIEKSSSPLERLTDGLSNTGMFAWLKAFTR